VSQKREQVMKFLVMVAALFVSGALLVPTLANARQHDGAELEKISSEIRYNPRDLKTPEGAARFQRKVEATIRAMCRNGRQSMPSLHEDTKRCIDDARQSIAPQVQLALESASHH
jgi:UrcA family protein